MSQSAAGFTWGFVVRNPDGRLIRLTQQYQRGSAGDKAQPACSRHSPVFTLGDIAWPKANSVPVQSIE